jgi:chromosome segregation ATPase
VAQKRNEEIQAELGRADDRVATLARAGPSAADEMADLTLRLAAATEARGVLERERGVLERRVKALEGEVREVREREARVLGEVKRRMDEAAVLRGRVEESKTQFEATCGGLRAALEATVEALREAKERRAEAEEREGRLWEEMSDLGRRMEAKLTTEEEKREAVGGGGRSF